MLLQFFFNFVISDIILICPFQVVAVFALVAFCHCQEASEPIAILKFENEGPNPDGSYKYR